jgi:hypothetical protein
MSRKLTKKKKGAKWRKHKLKNNPFYIAYYVNLYLPCLIKRLERRKDFWGGASKLEIPKMGNIIKFRRYTKENHEMD